MVLKMEQSKTAAGRNAVPSMILAWPVLLVFGFFAVPFALLVRASFANLDATTYSGSGFTLSSYQQLVQPFILNTIAFSLLLAITVATISLVVAFPATYFVTRLSSRWQITWIIGFLTTLALSEVLVTFAWQVLLSRQGLISTFAVSVGLLERPMSFIPSFGAMVACICYFVVPLNFLTLYPPMSRVDHSYLEASRTLGASPIRAFLGVLVPIMKGPISTSYIMTTVIAMGAYVSPLVLGGRRTGQSEL